MLRFLDGGSDTNEDPTLLGDNELQEATGVEYRVGKRGIFVARGREVRGGLTGGEAKGIYYAGFDGNTHTLIGHHGDSYSTAVIGVSMSFTPLVSAGDVSLPLIGVHSGNRHFLVDGSVNRVFENISGITSRPMGMVGTTVTIGTSVTQGVSSFTVSEFLTYWLTEYDSTRGIESVAGATAQVDAFDSKDSVVLTFSGTQANPNANKWRIYRSTDGGVFPDGSLLAEVPIAGTSYTDRNTSVEDLIQPTYGTIEIAGIDFDRDAKPPVLSVIGGPYQNTLFGIPTASPRAIVYTPSGRPESWPAGYELSVQTHRQDEGMAFEAINSVFGIFTKDTVHRISRIPRETDSAFSSGEALDLVTDQRGAISRRGVTRFSMPGRGSLIAFVARDGIWATDLVGEPFCLTDKVNWEARVDTTRLSASTLEDDPTNRQLVFLYTKANEAVNAGVMYLDYQRDFIRVTHPDHGSLVDAALAPYNGLLRLFSLDSRTDNLTIYTEGVTTTNNGSPINARFRTAEIFPSKFGPNGKVNLGAAQWMHDASGSTAVFHTFHYDRQANPRSIPMSLSTRDTVDVGLSRDVNSFSLEVSGSFTDGPGFHWVDYSINTDSEIGGSKGA